MSKFPTGSVVQQTASSATDAAVANSTDDKWHTLRVTLLGSQITTSIDNKKIVDAKVATVPARGHLAIQANSGKVAFRNLKVKPLETKPLLNGKDLTGWKVFPDKKSEYTITSAR